MRNGGFDSGHSPCSQCPAQKMPDYVSYVTYVVPLSCGGVSPAHDDSIGPHRFMFFMTFMVEPLL
jgi:hypothetical protein